MGLIRGRVLYFKKGFLELGKPTQSFEGRTGDHQVEKGGGEGRNQSKRNEKGNNCSVNLKQRTHAGEWVRISKRRIRS